MLLKTLKKIYNNMESDTYIFLTSDEKQLLQESYENEKKVLLVSSKNARKQLGI